MDNSAVPDVVQQPNIIYYQYFFLALLLPLYGYYNFIRLHGWLNGTIGLFKETATIIIVGQFYFGNSYTRCDNKRHIAERNIRQATHVANNTGIVFITLRFILDCYILTTNDKNTSNNENAFNIINNTLYLVVLMTIAFFIKLCFLKPGISELKFFVYILRYPWRFIWPTRQKEIFRESENKY